MKRALTRAKSLFLSLLLLVAPGCGQPSAGFIFDEVRYTVTGGIVGFDRTLRIAANGSYQVSDPGQKARSGRLSGQNLRELKALLKAVPWDDLQREYVDRRVVDSLFQSVTLRTDRLEYITTVGTGGNPPPPVAALVSFLDEILREVYAG